MSADPDEGGAFGLALAIARARVDVRRAHGVAPPEPQERSVLGLALLGCVGAALVLLAVAPSSARGLAVAPSPAITPAPGPEPTLEQRPERLPVARLGSVQAPVQVPSLPYSGRGDTRGASGAMDRYACAPRVDEGGGEVWYAVAVRGRGQLRAAITEDPTDGVDVDVHLLSRPDPDGCVARGDAAAEAVVEPGAWFVVVDTCASSGQPLPGPFALDLTFTRAPER